MKSTIPLSLFLLLTIVGAAQVPGFRLAEISDHYKELQQFSGAPDMSRAWMDTLKYPPKEYGNSVVYLIVKPYYLTEGEVKSIADALQFPANSSEQVRKELDYLLGLQSKRTANQVSRVEFLGNIGYWPAINALPSHPAYQQNLQDLFFEGQEVMGKQVNAMNFPKTSTLLQHIMQDMRVMEFTIKYEKLRARPYHLDSALQPLARMSSPSFASGHTLWAFLQAFTWSEIIPEKQKDFIALAEEIRRSREIMGIHYPSDNETARQVAYKMMLAYFRKDSFRNDLSDARHEWKIKSAAIFK